MFRGSSLASGVHKRRLKKTPKQAGLHLGRVCLHKYEEVVSALNTSGW